MDEDFEFENLKRPDSLEWLTSGRVCRRTDRPTSGLTHDSLEYFLIIPQLFVSRFLILIRSCNQDKFLEIAQFPSLIMFSQPIKCQRWKSQSFIIGIKLSWVFSPQRERSSYYKVPVEISLKCLGTRAATPTQALTLGPASGLNQPLNRENVASCEKC